MNGEEYTHIHIALAGDSGTIQGGHLLKCIISLTAEIFIEITDETVDRKRDEYLHINKLNFLDNNQ